MILCMFNPESLMTYMSTNVKYETKFSGTTVEV